jgi:hypothetical protein
MPAAILIGIAFAVLSGAARAISTLAGCPMFPPNHIWNTPVDSAPVHPDSASYVATIGAAAHLHPDFGTVYQGAPIGIP